MYLSSVSPHVLVSLIITLRESIEIIGRKNEDLLLRVIGMNGNS